MADGAATPDVFANPDPNVTPFVPWPDPPDGHAHPHLRPRRHAPGQRPVRPDVALQHDHGQLLLSDDGPRDPHKLSPHHHDDFEQISLQLQGSYVHHMRTPWTVNMAHWRDDEHQRCAAPAITIIPPPTIHTSQSVNESTTS